MGLLNKRQKVPLTCDGEVIGYVDIDSIGFWKNTTDMACNCGVTLDELASAYGLLTNDSMKPMDVKKAYERIKKIMEKLVNK